MLETRYFSSRSSPSNRKSWSAKEMKSDDVFAVGEAFFECVEVLGRGAFGDVFSVREVEYQGEQVESGRNYFVDAEQAEKELVHTTDGALSLRFARPPTINASPRAATSRRTQQPPHSRHVRGLQEGNVSTETRVQRNLQHLFSSGATDSLSSVNSLESLGREYQNSVSDRLSMRKEGRCDPLFALKVVQIRSEHQIHSLAEEIRILHEMRGERHVVQLLAAELDVLKCEAVMLLELAVCDLRQVLETEKRRRVRCGGAANEDSPNLLFVVDLFIQVCAAVQSVHAHGILHFDLKPENFLCFEKNAEQTGDTHDAHSGFVIKLADFGVSAQMTTCQTHVTRETPVGSIKYMAPETISQQQGTVYESAASQASTERGWV